MNNFEVALTKCFICGKDNEIIMNTRLTEKDAKMVKEMHGKVVSMEPCNECKEYMKKGVILISIRDGEKGNNPYRTGGFVVIKDEGLKGPDWNEAKKSRVCFVEDHIWNQLGLPRK